MLIGFSSFMILGDMVSGLGALSGIKLNGWFCCSHSFIQDMQLI